jgi:hypothetical protein
MLLIEWEKEGAQAFSTTMLMKGAYLGCAERSAKRQFQPEVTTLKSFVGDPRWTHWKEMILSLTENPDEWLVE